MRLDGCVCTGLDILTSHTLCSHLQISPTAFSELVNDINATLIDAHNIGKMWRDNILAVLTFYLTSALFSTHYRRVRFSPARTVVSV